MMGFFWPRQLHAETTPLRRFGRVLHWVGLAMGAPFALALALPDVDPYSRLGIAAIGLIPIQLGRAARYIFSGE